MDMMDKLEFGFDYTVEHLRNGEVIASEVVSNLVPTEGLNYIVSGALTGGPTSASWFIGLYEGNYVPTSTITAATVVSATTECVAYSNSTRPTWVGGTVTNGAVDNSLSRAEFTMTANKTVYGAFLVSTSAKSSALGTLLSIVRFASPKGLETGDVLRVTAGVAMVSA